MIGYVTWWKSFIRKWNANWVSKLKTRPLVILCCCCLSLLELGDLFSVPFLHPSLSPQGKELVGRRSFLEAQVLEPPAATQNGAFRLLVQSSTEKILLTCAFLPSVERGDHVRFETKIKRPGRYQNPGGFDYRRHLERQGVLLTGFLEEESQLLKLDPGERSFFRGLDALRSDLGRRMTHQIAEDQAGFLRALTLGDRSGISKDLWEEFQKTGTAHLVAISGQHIGMLAGVFYIFFFWLLRRSEFFLLRWSGRRWAAALSVPPVWLYTLLSGSSPSAERAAVLVTLLAISFWFYREGDVWTSLAAAAILITLCDPSAPFSASFQMSFLAVFGILVFRRQKSQDKSDEEGLKTLSRRLVIYLKTAVLMTVGATLWTAPWAAFLFHRVSASGLMTNLWAIPFSNLLLILSSLSLSLDATPLATPAWTLTRFLNRLFLNGIHVSANYSWTFAFYPTGFEVFLAYIAIFLLSSLHRNFSRNRLFGTVVVIAFLFLRPDRLLQPTSLQVTFLDVGQGDAALVISPEGESLLIDGGGFLIPGRARGSFDVGREVLIPYLRREGLKRIDRVLLSHPHPDHFGGLTAVFEEFPVGEFWRNGQAFPDPSFEELLSTASSRHVPERIFKTGDRFLWSGLEVETFFPAAVSPARNINDNSLVVRLSWNGASFLFSGDIEDRGEAALSDRSGLRATVLKIPHHGSKTSSSVPFIDTVHPQYAVVSLGDGNNFGFPHPGILEKYERRGVRVFRTDRDGAVTFTVPLQFPKQGMSIQKESLRSW